MSQLVPGGLEGKDGTMSQLVPGFLEGKDGTMPWQLQWNFRKPTPSPLAGKTPPLHANGCTRTTKNRGKRQKILNEEREPAVPSRRLSSLTHGADQRLVGALMDSDTFNVEPLPTHKTTWVQEEDDDGGAGFI